MTPNFAREIGAGMLGTDMPRIMEPWGDEPFAFAMQDRQAAALAAAAPGAEDSEEESSEDEELEPMPDLSGEEDDAVGTSRQRRFQADPPDMASLEAVVRRAVQRRPGRNRRFQPS
jgi:hypothetical protein